MQSTPKCCICQSPIPQDTAASFANGAWMHAGECQKIWEERFRADHPSSAMTTSDAGALIKRGLEAGRIRMNGPATTSRGA
jgi:hypothetical protein